MPKEIPTTKIALFKGKKIRKAIYQNEWWFSVVDVVEALTDSSDPNDYWYRMKIRVKSEEDFQPSTICRQLKLEAPDGKMRETDCANTEGMFRIVQSIPSPKAEPLKRWLAKVGGGIAGGARKKLEKRLKRSIVSKKNYLNEPQNKKLLKK